MTSSQQLTAVTQFEDSSVAQNECQLQRILGSSALRNCLTLIQLLRFLGSKAIEGNAGSLKEYTIGVEAFGRKSDFDPKTDTIVRVQTHRLRQKLREYYDKEGVDDPIIVEIPKGHYCPTFRLKEAVTLNPPRDVDEINVAPESPSILEDASHDVTLGGAGALKEISSPRYRLSSLGAIFLATLILLGLVIGFLAGSYQARTAAAGDSLPAGVSRFSRKAADPVKVFWATFVENDPTPIIAYPNAVFLLDDSNDLFRFRQGASDSRGARVDPHLAREFASNPTLVANAGQLYYENGYTGTGELESIAMLTTLFAQMGLRPIIKTSLNITPDDLQQHTVILLGSPFQNIAVAQLLALGDFTFQNPDSRREQWRAQIVNAHPEVNEITSYHTERDPDTQVLKRDYSLISIQPGVVEGHNIVVIGGLDTKGTEGATRFATSRSGVEQLSAALAAKGLPVTGGRGAGKGKIPWFQALVLVHLEKGDQVLSAELTGVHPFPGKKAPATSVEGSAPPQGK